MSSTRKLFTLMLAAGLTALPATVFSTNGMFLIGYGPKSRSMGGVGIGLTQDAIGFHQNPAGIIDLNTRIDAAGMLFRPIRSVVLPDPRDPPNAGNPVEYKSGSNLFAIPAGAAVFKFNRQLALGFSGVGAGGGQTRYTRLSPLGFNFMNPAGRTDVGETLGVSLILAEMSLGAAFKVHKQHSLGAALVVGVGQFRSYGVGVFKPFSSEPDNLTENGNDYSFGVGGRIGWKWKPHKRLGIGVAAQSKIYMQKFDKYEGLFAKSGGFDVPANYGAGIEFKATKDVDVAFDVQRVLYSRVNSIGNPIEQLALPDGAGFLGEKMGAGFGWRDQTIYKLGLKYEVNDQWDAMVGVNYGRAPMPSDQLLFSTLAPAVTEWHLSLGGTYRPSRNTEWSLAYVHAFTHKEKGVANSGGQFDQFFPNEDLTGPGDVELKMHQDSLEISFSYKL